MDGATLPEPEQPDRLLLLPKSQRDFGSHHRCHAVPEQGDRTVSPWREDLNDDISQDPDVVDGPSANPVLPARVLPIRTSAAEDSEERPPRTRQRAESR